MVNWLHVVSFDEVVGYWLNYEYHGRFKMLIDSQFKDVVPYLEQQNFVNPAVNKMRLKVLGMFRPIHLMLPQHNVDWWMAQIVGSDLDELLLINSGDWRFMTNGTLRPINAAQRIRIERGLVERVCPNQVNYILHGFEGWAVESDPSRLIIVGPKEGPYRVIDGVHRTVGLFLYHFVDNRGPFVTRPVYFGVTDSSWNPTFA